MPAKNEKSPRILIEGLAKQLAPLLDDRGLTVTVRDDGMIQIRNPAGYTDDPHGRALSPGMEQCVTAVAHVGGLRWAWVWTNRDAPPDIEPMVPVDDLAEAARRIANVLRADQPIGVER